MPHFATDLGRVAHALPDALVMIEPDGTISWLNQATLDLMGIEPVDWSGRSLWDLLPNDDDPVTLAEIESGVTSVRLQDGAGQWRRYDLRSRTVPAGTHGTAFVVLALRETT